MKKLPIDRYIVSKIPRDGIYLSCGMPEIFVPFIPKLPILSLMILYTSATKNKKH
jgi:hypothetical protein